MKKLIFIFSILTAFSTYAQVPKDNLKRLIPLNSNADDASGNGDNGDVNGAVLTKDRFYQPESAYSFDGVDDYIGYNTDNFGIKSELSLSIWIKTNKGSSATYWIAGKYNYDQDAGYQLMLANGIPRFSGRDKNSEYVNCSSADVINDNNWHHLVGVLNNKVWEIWVDGVLKNKVVTTHTNVDVSTTSPFELARYKLGGYYTDHYFFEGILDNSRLYSKALNAEDVSYLYYGDAIKDYTKCDVTVYDTITSYDTVKVTDTLVIDITITSIAGVDKINSLKVFPNPTNDVVNITTGENNSDLSAYTIKIVSVTGQVIFESLINQSSISIDISEFGIEGLYFIQIIDDNGSVVETRKLILK